jgi:hypothetical protein
MDTRQPHAHPFMQVSTPWKSDWSSLLDIVLPALDMVSTRGTARQGLELMSNAANTRRFVTVLTDTQAKLRDAGIPIIVQERCEAQALKSASDLTLSQRRWLGQLVLELYFAQLFHSNVSIIDLWPSRLGIDASGDAIWHPRPSYLRWDADFLNALRDLYAGFFLRQDERFQQGLEHLHLGSTTDLVLRHLGGGDQRSVRFGPDLLRATLRDISVLRGSDARDLHRNFLAFGLYVASLHELLGSLGLKFNVRSAFMRAHRSS